jgi:hypothetical protein
MNVRNTCNSFVMLISLCALTLAASDRPQNIVADGAGPIPPPPSYALLADGAGPIPPPPSYELLADGAGPIPPPPSYELLADGAGPIPPPPAMLQLLAA